MEVSPQQLDTLGVSPSWYTDPGKFFSVCVSANFWEDQLRVLASMLKSWSGSCHGVGSFFTYGIQIGYELFLKSGSYSPFECFILRSLSQGAQQNAAIIKPRSILGPDKGWVNCYLICGNIVRGISRIAFVDLVREISWDFRLCAHLKF